MGLYTIKLPDVGEGVAEAELVEWMVEEGQAIVEDQVLAAVMTDKATVEIPSPVEGVLSWRGASIGEVIAVGSPIIRIEIDGEGNSDGLDVDTPANNSDAKPPQDSVKSPAEQPAAGSAQPLVSAQSVVGDNKPVSKSSTPANEFKSSKMSAGNAVAARAEGESPLASPAVRLRARNVGIDLRMVAGSGPAGRITHDDIDQIIAKGPQSGGGSGRGGLVANTQITDVPVIGLRRKIAQQMSIAKERIVPITYVDEIDVTALEELRARLNKNKKDHQPKLTMLPFLMKAMIKAIGELPQMNALYDDETGVVHQYGGVHIGVATQTPNGLIVPVVRHAEARTVWECAEEVLRLAQAARDGSARRDELSGSTITITSLGAMGGLVTTPVINHPEVSIIGVNKMQVRAIWDGTQFIPRKIMNLSSSFDHRIIDGWDCALFIQRIKGLLESPAEIFIDE